MFSYSNISIHLFVENLTGSDIFLAKTYETYAFRKQQVHIAAILYTVFNQCQPHKQRNIIWESGKTL